MSRRRNQKAGTPQKPEEKKELPVVEEAAQIEETDVPAVEQEAESPVETKTLPDSPEPEAAPAEESTQQGEAAIAKKTDIKMIVFGAIVLIFALIGLVSSIVFVTNGVGKLIQQDSKQEEYEWLVTPIVLQDPPQFESPADMADSTIITAGVWRLIMNEDTSKYPVDDLNFITVPASDIEVQIKALFGDVSYTHQTVGDSTLMIMYDEQNNTYVFPAVPHVLAYTPQVQSVEKPEDGTVILTVGYIPPGPVWQGDSEGNRYQPSAEKVMEITLKADDNGDWKIYSLTSAEGQPTLPEESDVISEEDLTDPAAEPEVSEPAEETSEADPSSEQSVSEEESTDSAE